MKSIFRSFFLIFLILILVFPVFAATNPSAKTVSESIQKACPTEFGYVDNTEYYMSSYFSSLKDIDDFHIITCADSTNFSEIGVFHMKDTKHLSSNLKHLKRYLLKIKQNFENGVVYNVEEYPKFENAKAFSVGNYLIYVVLDREASRKAEQTARNLLMASS